MDKRLSIILRLLRALRMGERNDFTFPSQSQSLLAFGLGNQVDRAHLIVFAPAARIRKLNHHAIYVGLREHRSVSRAGWNGNRSIDERVRGKGDCSPNGTCQEPSARNIGI